MELEAGKLFLSQVLLTIAWFEENSNAVSLLKRRWISLDLNSIQHHLHTLEYGVQAHQPTTAF